MRETNPCCWFEIPVTNLARAKTFYESVFGVAIELRDMGALKMGFFPMKDDAYGAGGNLCQGEGYSPSHAGSVIYFSVTNIETTLANVAAAGGGVLLQKMGIGSHGFIALFQDSEGNRIGLHAQT